MNRDLNEIFKRVKDKSTEFQQINYSNNNFNNQLRPIMYKRNDNVGKMPIMEKVDNNLKLQTIMNKVNIETNYDIKMKDTDVINKNKSYLSQQTTEIIPSINNKSTIELSDNINKPENNMDIVKSNDEIQIHNSVVVNKHKYVLGEDYCLRIELDGELKLLCNFIVKPKKKIIEDDGICRIYKNCLTCFMVNGKSQDIYLYSKDLLNRNWSKQLGVEFYCVENMYAYLEQFISDQFREVPEEIIYVHVGWRNIKGKMVYLHGKGAIGLNSNENIYGSKDKIIECLNIKKDQALKRSLGLLQISNDLSKTLPMFLFSHLAVGRELFVQAGVEIKFCLWIYGLTGSMKTSVSKVFFNIFSKGNKSDITATFKDTISAIEMKSFDYKDSVLLVDDFHPTTSSQEKREMERLASEILRRYGDGICRARATKFMTKQKIYPPRGLCVITGEDKIGGESTVARYISIEVKPGDFKSKELAYFQNNSHIVSTHIYYFVEWISNNFMSLKDYVKDKFIKVRNENISKFRHGRMNEAFAVLCVIADVFLNYSIECGSIDGVEKENILFNWNNIIFNIIKTHESSSIQQSPGIMYLIAIKELLGSGKLYLSYTNNYQDKKEKEKSIGYQSEEKIYLIPKLAYAEVKNFWKNQGIEFPISEESTNKMLDEMEVIEAKFEGKTRRRTIKISGDNRRFLVVYKAKMEAMLEEID